PVLLKDDVHYANFLVTNSKLTLEGLELHLPQDSEYTALLLTLSGPIYLANCKLVVNRDRRTLHVGVSRGQIRNCLIVSSGGSSILYSSPQMQWTMDNNLIAHRGAPPASRPCLE